MIRSFRDRETERIWRGQSSRRLPTDIQRAARRKLRMLNNAATLNDLRVPPANRLEALKAGDRANTVSASTSNGGSASSGPMAMLIGFRLSITTELDL